MTGQSVSPFPAHWATGRLKNFGTFISGSGFPHEFQGIIGEALPFYKVADLATTSEDHYMGLPPNTVSYETASRLHAHIIPSGAIVYAKIGAALFLNRRRITTLPCCIDNNMTGYVPNERYFDIGWAFYWTTILDLGRLANPGAVPSLSEGEQKQLPAAVPPIAEQRTIADYLDRETARLDALVAAKEQVIGLLAEKRRALITRAVTRGLDPRAPLRDSGIPWLGQIPTHWETHKFTRAVSIIEGQVDPGSDPYVHWPLIAPNHVESGTGRLLHQETAADQSAISGKYLCRADDVIYSKIRPALRKATLAQENSLCSADMYSLRTKNWLQPQYLLFFLLSEPFSIWATLESTRVAMPKINREALSNIKILVPPRGEQREIVNFIATRTSRIDELQAATAHTITLLKERRSALIAAVVTGQIDIQ